MPKAKGYALNIVRLDRDHAKADFTFGDLRVRGTATMEALAAVFGGNVDRDANLAAGAVPVKLADFIKETFIPLDLTPRLTNQESFDAEEDLLNTWKKSLGTKWLHEIEGKHAMGAKDQWVKDGISIITIKRRWRVLRAVFECAKEKGLIKNVLLDRLRRLKSPKRNHIWPKLQEVDQILQHCPSPMKIFIEFLVLAGPRIREGLDLKRGDIGAGRVSLPTEKRGCPMREEMRHLSIESLGPRFARLLRELKPHPSGYYFYSPRSRSGRPWSVSHVEHEFRKACLAAGVGPFIVHDLRRAFANMRAMVARDFNRLRYELGHGSAHSIQSYIDKAKDWDVERDSIFAGARIADDQMSSGPRSPALTAPTASAVNGLFH